MGCPFCVAHLTGICHLVPNQPDLCVLSVPRKRIGRGKEGTVYELLLPAGYLPMALKLFDRGTSQKQRERSFDQHHEFLRLYKHTGMVPFLYGAGHGGRLGDPVLFLAMEYIDLALYEPLPRANDEIRRYGCQMLRGNPYNNASSWSDMYKRGNFLYNRQNENRRVVFLEGGAKNHPWSLGEDTGLAEYEGPSGYPLRPRMYRI